MYQPSLFEESRSEVLHALLRSHPLATLVTLTAQGLEANHIPLYLRTQGVERPTLVGLMGKKPALAYAIARGVLVSLGGLVWLAVD